MQIVETGTFNSTNIPGTPAIYNRMAEKEQNQDQSLNFNLTEILCWNCT